MAGARRLTMAAERLRDTMKRLVATAQGGTAVGTGINAHPRFGSKVAVLLAKRHEYRSFRPKQI